MQGTLLAVQSRQIDSLLGKVKEFIVVEEVKYCRAIRQGLREARHSTNQQHGEPKFLARR